MAPLNDKPTSAKNREVIRVSRAVFVDVQIKSKSEIRQVEETNYTSKNTFKTLINSL